MSNYPNTIFHFTKKKETLFKILAETFRPSYAREKISGPTQSKEFASPMVSFCDLRLSEISSLLNSYGPYGIGLTKKWAQSNGLNPVWYLSEESLIFDEFCNSIDTYFRKIHNGEGGKLEDFLGYTKSMNLWRYMKNYKGTLYRRDSTPKLNHVFADEKEWRYVPSINEIDFPAFVRWNQIESDDQKELLNSRIENHRLRFKASDIMYLIVNNDKEINQLIDILVDVKGPLYEPWEVEKLKSRIITKKQIKEDF